MSDPLAPSEVTEAAQPQDNRLPTVPEGSGDRSFSELLPLRNFLAVDAYDTKATSQLDFIHRELNPDGKLPLGELLNQLKHLEQRLGVPKLGETRYGKIYNYLKATRSVKNAEQIRDSYLA